MHIDTNVLISEDLADLAAMRLVDLGSIAFPSGSLAILEAYIAPQQIDEEVRRNRIGVPGPARITAAVADVGNVEGRPFALCLAFSDASVAASSTVCDIDVDCARLMIADADLLLSAWIRHPGDAEAAPTLPLTEAIASNRLTVASLVDAERLADGCVVTSPGLLTTMTGWGDGSYRIIRHDDAAGNLVRLVIDFLVESYEDPIPAIDFGPGPLAIAA